MADPSEYCWSYLHDPRYPFKSNRVFLVNVKSAPYFDAEVIISDIHIESAVERGEMEVELNKLNLSLLRLLGHLFEETMNGR